jgi:hypothetical protein
LSPGRRGCKGTSNSGAAQVAARNNNKRGNCPMATRKPSIDQDLIRDLANILNETDLTEIEIEQDDLRVA